MVFGRIRRLAAARVLALAGMALLFSSPSRADNVLAPIWTGIYLGVQGGAKWADLDNGFDGLSTRNVSGGGHVGFNWGLGGVVVGVEADANLDSATFGFSTISNSTTFDTDWSGTVRGRIGIPVGPALFYATVGYAWSDATIDNASGGLSQHIDHRFDGIVYGVGAEAYVLPNLSVRLEALHFDYSSDQLSIAGVAGGVEEFDPSDTVVRAGLTFHLN